MQFFAICSNTRLLSFWGRPLLAAKGEKAAKRGRGVAWVRCAPFLPPSTEADKRRQRTAFGATTLPRPKPQQSDASFSKHHFEH